MAMNSAKSGFMFVAETPLSKKDDARARRLVRSNATKYRWRQARNEPAQSGTHDHAKAPVLPQIIKMSLQVGAGVLDPFDSMPTNLPSDIVTKGMAYNKQIIIPKLIPLASQAQDKLQLVMPVALDSRALLNCLLIGAMVYQQATAQAFGIKETARETALLRKCRSEAISGLRESLRDPVHVASDVTIMSVLVLAFNGPFVKLEKPRRMPSQGPFKYLQSLYIYSSTENNAIHQKGLKTLIDLRGGLSQLSLPGLAAIVSSSDILQATQSLSHPTYEPYSLSNSTIPHISVWVIEGLRLKSFKFQNLADGFDMFETTNSGNYLKTVLEMMADYVAFIAEMSEEHPSTDRSTIIDQRNLVQHRLMSLPSAYDIPEIHEEIDVTLYECCRISAIIFSLLVVYPISYSTAPFPCLATLLKESWSTTNSRKYQRLHTWLLTMGAIASFSLPEDNFFIPMLAELASTLQLKTWEGYQSILTQFLWLPSTNDLDGTCLWITVVERFSMFS